VQYSVFGWAYATSGTVTENYRFLLSGQPTGPSGGISPISPLANAGGWTEYLMN
jgi:hypothetical protein